MSRFKDHFFHPLMEKINPGSQIHKVSTPEPLLKQLAYEISIRKGITPIQVISQGVHGSRHLGILMNLLEESSITFSVALQASTSYFPADIRSVKTSFGLYENDIHQLLDNNRFTINYNHRWDRLTHRLRRFTGFNIVNPFSLLPSRIAITNQQAMALANAEGFKTGFWTVNSKAAIRDVIKWGADMVTTDYPPRVVEVIEELYGKFPDVLDNTIKVSEHKGIRLGESVSDVSAEKMRDGVLG
jgi:glycerophosphoryl diester phosphodiesterase